MNYLPGRTRRIAYKHEFSRNSVILFESKCCNSYVRGLEMSSISMDLFKSINRIFFMSKKKTFSLYLVMLVEEEDHEHYVKVRLMI